MKKKVRVMNLHSGNELVYIENEEISKQALKAMYKVFKKEIRKEIKNAKDEQTLAEFEEIRQQRRFMKGISLC